MTDSIVSFLRSFNHILLGLVVAFVLWGFFPQQAQAQSCVENNPQCCTQTESVVLNTPAGCEPICDSLDDPYCVECDRSEPTCTNYVNSFCGGWNNDCRIICNEVVGFTGGTQGSCSLPAYSPNPSAYCGDGYCSASESCTSCPDDCFSQCPQPVCGDGACNGTETCSSCGQDCYCPPGDPGPTEYCGDGTCNGSSGENCSNCSADCGVCNYCGDGVCSTAAGEACDACVADCGNCQNSTDYCGNGVCNTSSGENCSNCESDCGVCQTDSGFCGDNSCDGFETCSNCETDCGTCPASPPWWQTIGGLVGALRSTDLAIRSEITNECHDSATCIAALMRPGDSSRVTESTGVVITGGGLVDTNGYTSLKIGDDAVAIGSTTTRVKENYAYFYRQFELGLNPQEDFGYGSVQDAKAGKPDYDPDKEYYYHDGDMTINNYVLGNDWWDVKSGESYVVFINGNLTLKDSTSASEAPDSQHLIQVEEGGFLAFIVSGNILFDHTVGHRIYTYDDGAVEGVFVADGTLSVVNAPPDISFWNRRFVGEGTFVGWSGVNINRNSNDYNNKYYPTEMFIYRPDFMKNAPEQMKRSQMIWQETN